jgi:hypothetical protein
MKYFVLLLATGSLLCAEQFKTGQAARAVIGQTTFTRQIPGTSQTLLGAVGGIALYNSTLFVADSARLAVTPQNNRVLIFRDLDNQIPGPKDSFPWDGVERCPVCAGFASVVLGQADFTTDTIGTARDKMRTPTAVATNGLQLVVADTDNNRLLIWNSIPVTNNQPPDVVLGQQDFTSSGINYGRGASVNDRGLRGPQGVWIDQEGGLWVADAQNNRVLRWNQIPRENGAPANLVLGAPNMTTAVQEDISQVAALATARNLLSPVSVTVDPLGRVLVADLGYNRVLIWNSIPRENGYPADIAVGQPDVESTLLRNAQNANNSAELCQPSGTDADGKNVFPRLCEATLSFPRYALSDGTRLFIADGGNSRVLVYNRVPVLSGRPAQVVLGQLAETLDQDSDLSRLSASDSLRTPMSLAWDGINLYVSDPYNRRVMVFTMADQELPQTGVRNAASREVYAVGVITFTADPKENDEVTLKISSGDTSNEYKYKAGKDETIANVINGLVGQINAGAGNALVFATPNVTFNSILLTARQYGDAGNQVAFALTYSDGAQLAGTSSGNLSGGQDAAKIAPGTVVTIIGDNLADETASAPENANPLPSSLGGAEVYIDGIQAPLLFVSPTEIRAQMPWEVNDSSSVNAYVRIRAKDGQVRTTTAIGVPIIPQNPGIFATEGVDPRPARAYHTSGAATGVISVDGSAKAGDQAIVTIGEDRNYGYTVKEGDTLTTIRDALINEINADSQVEAVPSTQFTRIILRARTRGPEGEGIPYGARANEGANVILTSLSPALCCASKNGDGSPVTEDDPAKPGEIITVYATGLGLVGPDEAKFTVATGWKYGGPAENQPNAFVDAIAGGKTANVLTAGLAPGMVGVYEIRMQLNSDIPTNPQTQLTIAQDIYVSNIVTFAVVNPNEPPPAP